MDLLCTIVFIGTMLAVIYFGYQAEKSRRGSKKRRNNVIMTGICFVIMIGALIVKGMN